MASEQEIRDFLEPASKIAYLAGAGISSPEPSCLPKAIEFMAELFKNISIDETTKELLMDIICPREVRQTAGDYLRFETVMAILSIRVNPELDVLKVFASCNSPNYYHYYLADKLSQGAIILTTNFDNLIEHACRKKGIDYDLIVSEKDFENFLKNPDSYLRPLIKLHGGFDAIRSDGIIMAGMQNVVATEFQVGRLFQTFQNTSHVLETISNVFYRRRIIVIGYSGGDDFDIIPAIRQASIEKGILWVNHHNCTGVKNVFDQSSDLTGQKRLKSGILLEPHYRLLEDLKRRKNISKLLFVEGNTVNVLQIPIYNKSDFSEKYGWTKSFEKWTNEFLKDNVVRKILITEILHASHHVKECMLHSKDLLDLGDKLNDEQRAHVINTLAYCQYSIGDYASASKNFMKIKDFPDDAIDPLFKAYSFHNLGRIFSDIGKPKDAIAYLRKAEELFEKSGNLRGLSEVWHELGRVDTDIGLPQQSIDYLNKSIKSGEILGDIAGVAMSYYELGRAFQQLGRKKKGEEFMEKAIELFSLSGHPDGLAVVNHGFGKIAESEGNLSKAESYYKEAIHWGLNGGNKINLAHSHNNLGMIYVNIGKYELAKEELQKSLGIKRTIGDIKGTAISNINLGHVFLKLKRMPDAVGYFQEAITKFQEIGDEENARQTKLLLLFMNMIK